MISGGPHCLVSALPGRPIVYPADFTKIFAKLCRKSFRFEFENK